MANQVNGRQRATDPAGSALRRASRRVQALHRLVAAARTLRQTVWDKHKGRSEIAVRGVLVALGEVEAEEG